MTPRDEPGRDNRLCFWPDLDRLTSDRSLWSDEAPLSEALQRAQDQLRCALARLTPSQREAVELFYFDGLSEGQIGHRLGVSQQTIHRRIHGAPRGGRVVGGALARLRALLGEWRGRP
ncbi:MAG: hypothetical protein AMXMBFR23_28540 [Chloroflexota bacterium]